MVVFCAGKRVLIPTNNLHMTIFPPFFAQITINLSFLCSNEYWPGARGVLLCLPASLPPCSPDAQWNELFNCSLCSFMIVRLAPHAQSIRMSSPVTTVSPIVQTLEPWGQNNKSDGSLIFSHCWLWQDYKSLWPSTDRFFYFNHFNIMTILKPSNILKLYWIQEYHHSFNKSVAATLSL